MMVNADLERYECSAHKKEKYGGVTGAGTEWGFEGERTCALSRHLYPWLDQS